MTDEELDELRKRNAAEQAAPLTQNTELAPSTDSDQRASAAAVGGPGGFSVDRSNSDIAPSGPPVVQDAIPSLPSGVVAPVGDANPGQNNEDAIRIAGDLINSDEQLTLEELARQRESANAITSRETADLKARSGAGGFGVSFASDAAISDIARAGQRETELSLDDAKRQSKADQLDRILAGAGLSRATAGEARTAEQEALINQLIEQTLNEEEPTPELPPEGEQIINDALAAAGTGDLAGATDIVKEAVYDKLVVMYLGMGWSQSAAENAAAATVAFNPDDRAAALTPEEEQAAQGTGL